MEPEAERGLRAPSGEPPTAPDHVESKSDVRRLLEGEEGSAFQKYQRLAVGKSGALPFLRYELLTSLLGPAPGAAGYLLRKTFYRRALAAMGKGVIIGRNVTIRHPHRIRIGDRVVIDDFAVLDGKGTADNTITIGDGALIGRNSVLSCKDGTIRIGSRANISLNCTLISETALELGDRVMVAGHCYLIAGGNHGIERTDVPIIDQPRIERGGIRVGDNAWLGASTTVLDGVRIGRDAVIGAGAVVRSDVEDFAIAAGVPARTIRHRKPDHLPP